MTEKTLLISISALVIGLIIGFIIGSIFIAKTQVKRAFGTIKWVSDDDKTPYLYLDMDRPPEQMIGESYVIFKTDLKTDPHD